MGPADAAATDWRRVLAPRSVALVGATGRADNPMARPLRWLTERGFAGRVHPVNPKYDELGGVPCAPPLADVPGTGPAADRDDLAGEVGAGPARRAGEHRHEAQVAVADLPVERIEARGRDAHLHLARGGVGRIDVDDLEDLRRAEAAVADGAHLE